MTEYELPTVERHPYLWGNLDTPGHLPDAASEALAALGATPPAPPVPVPDATLPSRALPEAV